MSASEQPVPPGVEVSSDLDGIDILMPGAGLSAHELTVTWAWLGGMLSSLMAVMAVFSAWQSGRPLLTWLTLAFVAVPWVGILPFLLLGAARAWGTRMALRIEPAGHLVLTWLADPVRIDASSLVDVEVADAPPRVVLHLQGLSPQPWSMRTVEHAEWLAAQLRVVLERQRALREGEQAVPRDLEGLRDRGAVLER